MILIPIDKIYLKPQVLTSLKKRYNSESIVCSKCGMILKQSNYVYKVRKTKKFYCEDCYNGLYYDSSVDESGFHWVYDENKGIWILEKGGAYA